MQEVFEEVEYLARNKGYGSYYDVWGDKLELVNVGRQGFEP